MSLENGTPSVETSEERELATLREAYLERLTRPGQPFALAGVFPLPDNLQALYQQLTQLKDCLDSFRPLYPVQSEKLRETFDTEFTYHSNKIEGNTLTLVETDLVINKGMKIAGKSQREHSEAINHLEAIDFIRDLVGRRDDLTPHNLSPNSCPDYARYRGVPVTITGSRHEPPQPYMIVKRMEDVFAFYHANKKAMHPVQLAAEMHEKLVTVHPFIDGNGRTSRLVMKLLLLRGSCRPEANLLSRS